MKKRVLAAFLLILALSAFLTSCKKEKSSFVHLSSEKEYLSDGPPIFDSNVIFETEFLMNAISDKAKGKCTIDKVKERYETLYETLYD